MTSKLGPLQRQQCYQLHVDGQTYAQIAQHFGVSQECVRYWCRRQRDGGDVQTHYGHRPPGLLGSFAALVRYVLLSLRLHHPRWGPRRLLVHLRQRPSLHHRALPSMASIGRYLHQWPRFRRHHAKPPRPKERPSLPTAVHQRWQVDFKLGIALRDQTLVNLHTVHDPVGEVCIGATLFPAGHVGCHPRQVTLPEVQATLRACFTRWHTLPDEVQTDGDPVLRGREDFPSRLTLWLQGLGIQHLVIRPGRPTDNAEVERCHRTVHDYALVGNERYALAPLQELLNQAVQEMASTLPSRAQGCAGQPPLLAHPDLLQPRRPYQPDRELLLFDLRRVDAYLATYTWERKVGRTGQITLGGRHTAYSVGRASAGQHIRIRFDPSDRSFVFSDAKLEHEIGRRPARGLGVADLTGIISLPSGPVPQQLPLPEPFWRGVSC